MGWPGMSDYRDAVQNPDRVFEDPRLRQARVATKNNGLPKVWSGQLALVFKLETTPATAVRVFLSPNQDREQRYGHVRAHLSRFRPPCLVGFDYRPRGIRVGTDWFPILTMDWVDGEKLGNWMGRVVQAGSFQLLGQMADRWIELVESLHKAKIAHGDLHHDNVMVVEDRPILVDYDAMCVPAIVGWPALEFGLPAYQHPARKPDRAPRLGLHLDHFAAWIILISLRAVQADPSLWTRYVQQVDNENLLFSEQDIVEPRRSRLWGELAYSSDANVRTWSAAIRKSLDYPDDLSRVPAFEIDFLGPLRKAIARRDWQAIHDESKALREVGRKLPADIAQPVATATRKVEARARAGRAVRQGGPREVVAALTKFLPAAAEAELADWPACADLLAKVRQAREQVALLNQLDHASKRAVAPPYDGPGLVRWWDGNQAKLPPALEEVKQARHRVDAWRALIEDARELRSAIDLEDEAGIVRAADGFTQEWQVLGAAGTHPLVARHAERITTARCRQKDLTRFDELVRQTPCEELDRELAAIGERLKGCHQAMRCEKPCGAARNRLAQLGVARDLIERAKRRRAGRGAARGAEGDEGAIRTAIHALPANYAQDLTDRLRTAESRLGAHSQLERALHAQPVLDMKLAEAWDEACKVKAQPADAETIARCELAVRRRERLRLLDAIDGKLPVDEQDRQWLELWDDQLLKECHDVRVVAAPLKIPRLARRDGAAKRTALMQRFRAALAGREVERLRRLIDEPLIATHPDFSRLQSRARDLIERAKRVDEVLKLLDRGDDQLFLAKLSENLPLLQSEGAAFVSHRARIETWAQNHVLDQALHADGARAFLDEGGRVLNLSWSWNHALLVRRCLVAIGVDRHPDSEADAWSVVPVDNASFTGAGGARIVVPAGATAVFVSVWPVIDLGWAQLRGKPLKLGPFRLAPALADTSGSSHDGQGWARRARSLWESFLDRI